MNLPPLPELDPKNSLSFSGIRYANGYPESHVRELLREYGESCARMAREEAAKACEALADPIDSGWDECIDACAAAIRKG